MSLHLLNYKNGREPLMSEAGLFHIAIKTTSN
ncbi:ring-cleavage extradiol dioxygenase [Staphylococcus aureus]|uniref:Ring-cleavage extradiol dioxygenase n=1 Tax=Staphylococcus aureus TaxID=1280 RepID=A0A380DR66_STAAU|nr:ring-cleavage extradiol dioxygenase [Staphylococcus aureus]